MVIVAMCTGMRVSEVLALRWEHTNFGTGEMLVQRGVVNGRIGKVKTEASNDYIPLDPAFAQILLKWKGENTTGLVFPSPVNGQCYNAGTIQQHILRASFKKIGLSAKGLGWHTFRHTYRAHLDETGARSESNRNSCDTATLPPP
jgi:integrase